MKPRESQSSPPRDERGGRSGERDSRRPDERDLGRQERGSPESDYTDTEYRNYTRHLREGDTYGAFGNEGGEDPYEEQRDYPRHYGERNSARDAYQTREDLRPGGRKRYRIEDDERRGLRDERGRPESEGMPLHRGETGDPYRRGEQYDIREGGAWSGAQELYGPDDGDLRRARGSRDRGFDESHFYPGHVPRDRKGPKGYVRSDERIREFICEHLTRSAHLDVSDVSVSVADGHVTLEGTVPERRMKHMIEDVADGCWGVHDVDNRIRVARDAQQRPGGAGGDDAPQETPTDEGEKR